MSESAPRRRYRLSDFPRVVSCFSVAAGALVLVGWFFDVTTLKGVLPGWTLIKANTAAAMILCGMALWETQASARARLWQLVGQVCSGVVLLLGLLTVAEYVSGVDFGIDQLLIREVSSLPGDISGRMAVNTALALAALAAALLLVFRGTSRFITGIHALLLVPIMAAGSALIGYSYDIEQILREKLSYTPMAFPTAVHVVHHQDVFGGNGTVGFQLEAPMAVRVLMVEEAIPCSYKRLKELFFKKGMTELAQRLCQVLTLNGFFHN